MAYETRPPAEKRNDDPLNALARRERWVVTTAEMLEVGVSGDVVASRVESGWLVRQFRGVYLVGRVRPSLDELERAALKACGEGAVLSHRSAAVRWKLLRSYRGPVEVTSPTRRRSRGRLKVHQAKLHPKDITVKDGVRITTLPRTLVDLASVVDEPVLLTAVHEAEYLKRLHVPTVDAAIARAGRKRHGLPALRRCLTRYRPTQGTVNRGLEKRFIQFLRRHGFPPTRHNVPFALDDGEEVHVDVLFPDHGVAVELDGGVHEATRNFYGDRRRDRRLEALYGLIGIRVTDEDLDLRETELAADLWASLSRRGR